MLKNDEIKMIKKLCESGSYFAEYFAKDLHAMVGNIENDFPIELNCKFNIPTETINRVTAHNDKLNEEVRLLKKDIDSRNQMIEDLDTKLDNVMTELLICENQGTEMNLNKFYHENDVIKRKLQLGIYLTEAETNKLIEML